MRHTRAIINLKAIKANLASIKSRLSPQTGLLAVVKANAYGHGLTRVAQAAVEAGCSHLAVALPEEGAALREVGLAVPIVVLGLIAPEEAELCALRRLTVTVCDTSHLPPLVAAAKKSGRRVNVLLKVNTGMNRIGANPQDALALAGDILQRDGLAFAGLFTHFAAAGGPSLAYAQEQTARFKRLLQDMGGQGIQPSLVSAAASGAAFTLPDSQFGLARAGIAMYGLYPSDFVAERWPLQPALQWVTRIAHIRGVLPGEPVGYEMAWRAGEPCRIAVLPVGYGDGYSRLLSNKAEVLIGGRRYPVVGNVCMDQLMVCLGQDADAQTGDPVVLVGPQEDDAISFEELARKAGTINYELACNIAARVPRVYINS